MPKQTFFNLSEEKRQRIIKAALNEFADHQYLKTSINRIIEQAEISKGSFYQYFENKKDLYKYIIDQATETKMKFLRQKLQDYQKHDFFRLLRELFIAGIQLRNRHPLISKIGDRLLSGENEALKNEQIEPKIDIKFTAFMLTNLSISISNYFFENHDPNNLDEIMDYVDKMLYIMKNGIAKGGEK